MSNTSLQRKMNDARLAGLNPILALNAQGASTPTAVQQSPTNQNTQNPIGDLIKRRDKKNQEFTNNIFKLAGLAAMML